MGQALIQSLGGQPQKPARFVPIATNRFIMGLYIQRSLLRGALNSLYTDFYHMGQTDVLCDGLNTEVSSRSTIIRRPGNPLFSTAETSAAIDSFYAFHESNGTIQVIADSATDVEVVTPTSIANIFTKTAGAGQGYFAGVNLWMYISDGIDLVKYIPGVLNSITGAPIFNWGGAAPTTAPTDQITETGSAGVVWQALTAWTTMGLISDGVNIQQLTSVNALGTNITQFGETGNGQPNWNLTPGSTTTETSGTPITWTNFGPVVPWAANKLFNNFSVGGNLTDPCFCYDITTGFIFGNTNPSNAPGTTGPTKPGFLAIPDKGTLDPKSGGHPPGVEWYCLAPLSGWKPSTAYAKWATGIDGGANAVLVPNVLPPPAGQNIFVMVASNAGTSGTGGTAPPWQTAPGNTTPDNELIWTCIGPKTRSINTFYAAWAPGNATFGVFVDPAGNYQVCTSSGTSSGTASSGITWGTGYGAPTADGSTGLIWTCVGRAMTWAPNTIWYLPAAGFAPPQAGSQPYGGANLIDSNGNVEYVTESGISKSGSHPVWGTVGGAPITDGTVTWQATSVFTAVGFSWTKGMGYCYSFKARLPSDLYVTVAPPLQMPGTDSPNIIGPLGPPTGCQDGSVTTASPVLQIIGPNAGAQVLLSGLGSLDPQFDTIEIYRSTDGFGSAGPYLFLTDLAMPPPVNGKPGRWHIIDFMPDLATATLNGLNPLVTAPIDDANDPPPGQFGSTQFTPASAVEPQVALAGTAMIGQVYHQGRLWGFIGNTVFASGGPDTAPGNGFTAWPPDNAFPFQSNVILLTPNTAGLIVWTTTDVYFIGGGPAITDYYSQLLVPKLGILSPNAVTVLGGQPYVFSSDRQLLAVDPTQGVTRVGHPIGALLTDFDPADVYLTYHSYGEDDHALFIADGSSQWYRCDVNPTPDGAYTGPVFSPRATITGGFQAIASIETSPGTHQLLIGPTGPGMILARDSTFTTFTDHGSPYDAFVTIGNINFAHAGQMAEFKFIEADYIQIGTQPTVSVLIDEIAATSEVPFEVISIGAISDPPKLYGPTAVPETLWMSRYYFSQTITLNPGGIPDPAWGKSLQLKIDFKNDAVQNELLAFCVYAALWQES